MIPEDFETLQARWSWTPIAGCPGRYKGPSELEEVPPERLVRAPAPALRFEPRKARDPVWVLRFGGGGILSYMQDVGRYVHTLNDTEGLARKLQDLGLPPDTGIGASPTGLTYTRDYIGRREAQELLARVDAEPWSERLRRRVQQYGFIYDHRTGDLDRSAAPIPAPDWLAELRRRLCAEGFFDREPDQIIVNEYGPEQGIGSHVDTVSCFERTIASISLGSACVMDLEHLSGSRRLSILVEPGSLLVLGGEARYEWRHGIDRRAQVTIGDLAFRRERRVSITLRTVSPEPSTTGQEQRGGS